jgi:hypothetical protein
MAADGLQSDLDSGQVRKSTNGRYLGKAKLLTRDQIDGRSSAAQQFDAIADGITADLGGVDQLSTVQKHLVEAFAGAALSVNDLNMKLLLGKEIDILEQSTAISTLVRVASRIGLHRVARDVTSLGEILRSGAGDG